MNHKIEIRRNNSRTTKSVVLLDVQVIFDLVLNKDNQIRQFNEFFLVVQNQDGTIDYVEERDVEIKSIGEIKNDFIGDFFFKEIVVAQYDMEYEGEGKYYIRKYTDFKKIVFNFFEGFKLI